MPWKFPWSKKPQVPPSANPRLLGTEPNVPDTIEIARMETKLIELTDSDRITWENRYGYDPEEPPIFTIEYKGHNIRYSHKDGIVTIYGTHLKWKSKDIPQAIVRQIQRIEEKRTAKDIQRGLKAYNDILS